MRLNRFFCDRIKGEELILDAEESHHLLHVLRLKPQTRIEIYNGNGSLLEGIFIKEIKGRALIAIKKSEQFNRPPVKIAIAAGLTRSNLMDEIVRRVSEIGIDQFIAFRSRHTSEEFYPSAIKRWKRTALQTLKISGLLFIPEFIAPLNLENLLNIAQSFRTRIFFDINGQSFKSLNIEYPVIGLIGPPGDFSEQEKDLLLANNFKTVKINDSIMKTETAAILAAGMLKNA